jgi:hypothetical protein
MPVLFGPTTLVVKVKHNRLHEHATKSTFYYLYDLDQKLRQSIM